MSPTPTNKKAVDTARKSAEALAHKALQARVSLVGAIGEAQASAQEILDQREALLAKHAQELDVLDAEHADAEDKIKTAYDTAVSGGWTARELTEMGYSAPKKKKPRRQKPAAAETPQPATPPTPPSQTGEQPSRTDHND